MQRIIENKAQCLECFEIIFSSSRHDFVTCMCGSLSVDGGRAYLKRSFKPEGKGWQELSITEEVADE